MDDCEAKARLLTERAAAEEQLTSMGADLDAVAAAAAGSNVDDEHDPEGSTIAFEREQLAGLRVRVQDRVRDIDAALERLRHGHYGRCEKCGNPIGDARLEALPAARLCVTCADRAGRRT